MRALGLTRQLQDLADYAEETGRRFDLYVRAHTFVTRKLRRAVNEGRVTIRYIPE